jgi:rod shape-determining protein MreD
MMQVIWHRMDVWARGLTPTALTMIAVILSMMPTHIPGFSRVAPILALVSIYHWAVYRPHLLPAIAVFYVGILQDFLVGAPIGMNALVFLTVYGLILSQRRFLVGKSFLLYWFGFALVALIAALQMWLLGSIYFLTLLDINAVLSQYLVTLGLFPVIAWLFLRWQRAFLDNE